jgi:phenylacetate-CoA ligase
VDAGDAGEIERRLGISALDIYGLSEVMGPGVAMECLETADGPTIWEDHFFPEVVNPNDGTPLADGEHGELLFTTLTKEALPVIRYRTRDLTRLLPGTARTMRRMDRISGRSDDMLIIRGVTSSRRSWKRRSLKSSICRRTISWKSIVAAILIHFRCASS